MNTGRLTRAFFERMVEASAPLITFHQEWSGILMILGKFTQTIYILDGLGLNGVVYPSKNRNNT